MFGFITVSMKAMIYFIEMILNSFGEIPLATVDRLSAHSVSVDSRPTVDNWLLTDCRATTDSQPTADRQSIDSRLSVDCSFQGAKVHMIQLKSCPVRERVVNSRVFSWVTNLFVDFVAGVRDRTWIWKRYVGSLRFEIFCVWWVAIALR